MPVPLKLTNKTEASFGIWLHLFGDTAREPFSTAVATTKGTKAIARSQGFVAPSASAPTRPNRPSICARCAARDAAGANRFAAPNPCTG